MATLEIDYQPDLDSDHCIAYITLEPKSIDKDATLQVIGEINVKDPFPVNNSRVLFKKSFRTTSAQMEVELPARFDRGYSYAGKKIDVIIKVRLIVDDALIFDSQTKDIMPEQALQKPTITRTGKELADPKDAVSLPRSFGAISPTDQVKAAALLMAGLVVIGVLMTAGWNRLAGQGAFGAFLGAVAGSVATGAGVWYLLRKLLARYVTFALHPNLHIEKDRFYTVGGAGPWTSTHPSEQRAITGRRLQLGKGPIHTWLGKQPAHRQLRQPRQRRVAVRQNRRPHPSAYPDRGLFSRPSHVR